MTRKLAFIVAAAMLGVLTWVSPASAQDATSGAIQGVVRDKSTGESLIGVTVVATSTSLQGTQTAITDASGRFKITGLPSGTYLVTFYYADATVKRPNVEVQINKTTPVYTDIDMSTAGGEIIVIEDKAPAIDPSSTTQGISLDENYTKNMPVGRTFASVLGAAAGSSDDALGVSFSGSTSLENTYVVDGVNTTDLNFGTIGTAVVNDFIEEIEVITGGYQAEYGRSTGGVVNVVTKSGSNELHGSVFGYLQPGALVADSKFAPTEGTSIDATSDLAYNVDVGFDLGGPIIKDKVWFYVGFAPSFSSNTINRITKRRTDCRMINEATGELSTPADEVCSPEAAAAFGDGNPDIDPATGFYIYEQLDSQEIAEKSQTYQWVSKVNFAVTPEHQGQVTFQGTPARGNNIGVLGERSATSSNFTQLTTDLAGKWTSKFNNNKTEVDLVLGWHRSKFTADSVVDAANDDPLQVLLYGDLYTWGQGGRENMRTVLGCRDGAGDKYPGIANCPDEGFGYAIGGLGGFADDEANRISARLAGTQRFKALGHHEIKGGLDVEDNYLTKPRGYTGGALYQLDLRNNGSGYQVFRYVKLAENMDSPGPQFDETCYLGQGAGAQSVPCNFIGDGEEGSIVAGNTFNWAAFLQDSWAILPNLTLNAGIRYEEQRLRYAEHLQDEFGTNAMELTNMWAPRFGMIYDWTKEGRSKVYASWGRFYESIPMRINERSFGGEASYRAIYSPYGMGAQCGATNPEDHIGGPNGTNCSGQPVAGQILGTGVLVAPDISSQFLDEFIIGAEYEIMDDLKIGLSYQNRRLGRVIEDVSVDGANTYILANPGEFSEEAEAELEEQISALPEGSPERAELESQLEQFRGIRIFDEPRRDYHALQAVLTKRFSKDLFAQVSYTYSRTFGNYGGLYSADNGQVDPNISSQYDLLELLANRDGALPQDRPHQLRVDAYRIWDFDNLGEVVTGGRVRMLSGQPIDTLGTHYIYGSGESFLLPRGTMGRTDVNYNLDLHLAYGRDFGNNIKVEVFADFFNLLNLQDVFVVDERYTFDSVNPVVGGDYSDLVFAKRADTASGDPLAEPLRRNPNFLNPRLRYAPFVGRFGARMTF